MSRTTKTDDKRENTSGDENWFCTSGTIIGN